MCGASGAVAAVGSRVFSLIMHDFSSNMDCVQHAQQYKCAFHLPIVVADIRLPPIGAGCSLLWN